ncbi:MAG TPA: beta-1-3, beta-1-6-glucan biosynthesis protein [Pseudolabrys sp.]|nr:beta-1-3, beta-1-6-glucan biosynthesis protein [Pseudolabrys sp.]
MMGFSPRLVSAALIAATLSFSVLPALAQSGELRRADQPNPADNGKNTQKTDELAEAATALNGPAGNPECVWLGRRVVSLLWRDDLDTAFRHLDLYDRFGCPGPHIQATFRCLVRQGNIDPKQQETLNGRVHACWLNPNLEPAPATAAAPPAQAPAATSGGTTQR